MVICRPPRAAETPTEIPLAEPPIRRSAGPVLLPRPRPSSWALTLIPAASGDSAEVRPEQRPVPELVPA